MTLITIATAPKPFANPHIAVIQYNAIQSWIRLGPEVKVLLVGDEPGMRETAAEIGVQHIPQVARNAQGTPLVSSIFNLMRQSSDSPLLLYVNADILLLSDFLIAARRLLEASKAFLGVGQRWDLDIQSRLDFQPGWEVWLRMENQRRGRLHAPVGSDYFLFPRELFVHVPDFAIGRAGWDNWMIYEARRSGWQVVDLTPAVTVIHQNHDYSHLPDGKPHYQLPESAENVRLAGGRRTIFTLKDANFRFQDAAIRPIPLRGQKFWREVEIFPLVTLHSSVLGELFFAIFHPLKAWREWRARLGYKLRVLAERLVKVLRRN